ncbi:hypothetical protein IFM89_001689 [Coptis chinensis]|uniref:Uncharacterized protein n=1 Tax=Coptis chinensis TaxID=261450 RepID=A0A835HMR2_9MAGN|nr:hypothetical protein IFM89_001689 [Coptis chinensis]
MSSLAPMSWELLLIKCVPSSAFCRKVPDVIFPSLDIHLFGSTCSRMQKNTTVQVNHHSVLHLWYRWLVKKCAFAGMWHERVSRNCLTLEFLCNKSAKPFTQNKQVFQANRGRILNTNFILLQNPFSKSFSKSTENKSSSSFTVSYLEKSCGLSTEAALKAAKRVHFENATNPDSVLKFFQQHGFTNTQISTMISKLPLLLLSDPNKTLEPKLQFLKEVGFSDTDIGKLLSKSNSYLFASLEHTVIPSFNSLKMLLQTEKNVVSAIRTSIGVDILRLEPQKFLEPKIQILRDHGVPDSNISRFISIEFQNLGVKNNYFNDTVKELIAMGISPSSKGFAQALCIVSGMTKAKREVKMGVYKSFGWSDEEILMAFTRQPTCLAISEEKLRIGLDFFINRKKWEPARLAKAPNILGLSMEKRIIPRLNVIEFLISKCLLEKDMHIVTPLFLTDAKFIQKYVAKYGGRVPELLKLYQGKLRSV